MLKKPLNIDDDYMCINDADGEEIAEAFLRRDAAEIIHCVNCHDDLLAACERAYRNSLIDDQDEQMSHDDACYCTDTDTGFGLLQCIPCQLRAAISKAKPEPASRPDVTTEEVR